MNENAIVVLRNIRKAFPNKEVLKGIDMEIGKGQFVAILGKSGCGKSTMLNIIGMLDKKYHGEYYFDGILVKKRNSRSIMYNNIGFVFQMYFLINSLTVIENINVPFLYRKKPANYEIKLNYLIDELGLLDIVNERCINLSGGEKQRVAIARALITNPRLIICDEPTGNLDSDNAAIILSTLKKEQKTGTSIVVVTHSESLGKKADVMYYMEDGVIKSEKNV